MDKVLRLERLDTDPNTSSASKEWLHWKRTFENFLTVLPQEHLNKLSILVNYISPSIFQYIEDSTDYQSAMDVLAALFVKPTNEIYARHTLATRRQQANESLDEVLKTLSKDCNFKNATAAQYCDEYIRDAFITGMKSSAIRQRLLENKTLDLKTMVDQAQAMESAVQSSESYTSCQTPYTAAAPNLPSTSDSEAFISVAKAGPSCFFCGNSSYHPRYQCPARRAICIKCQKKGHFAKVCQASLDASSFASTVLASTTGSLSASTATVIVNGKKVQALFDSGSSESFISPSLVSSLGLQILPHCRTVSMASSVFTSKVSGKCLIKLEYQGETFNSLCVSILPGSCSDLILGLDFQSQHKSIIFQYGGSKPTLSVCGLSTLNISPPEPFANLTADCHPIATKSRRYSHDDLSFIDKQVHRLLFEGVIEPSQSPWRAQVVVTKDENHKKRLVIDYSQTINRFTLPDAFPLPNISEMINGIAQYRVFSTIDLRSAYHQVPLKDEDKPYTAFEARQGLYQFRRLSFGVTNGVACFQREMIKFVQNEDLQGVFPYLDNITICGTDQTDHDVNLKSFLEAARRKNITYNDDKSVFSTRSIAILGYVVEEGKIRPEPERLRPLRELPVPTDTKSLKRCLGLFSYYSQWIPAFSDHIKPLTGCVSFPLSLEAVEAFENLKVVIERGVVTATDENKPFEVETDASEVALAATLNQDGKPVALFSRTLQGSELKHSSIEKEAQAIIEAVRHWKHFLTGRHFTLKTDQKSVSYMFDRHHSGKNQK